MDELGAPFRWDLTRQPVLGSMVGDTSVDTWFLPELVRCAGQVIARSGHGDLVFVGRSLDSMADLLGSALDLPGVEQRVLRIPFSFARGGYQRTESWSSWRLRALTDAEVAQFRAVLTGSGLTPAAMVASKRPTTFVDVVHHGGTFEQLFTLLRSWSDDAGVPWSALRLKVRFLGVTSRRSTSPKTWRWSQWADWARELPKGGAVSVSMDPEAWSYFGNTQAKVTESYRPDGWIQPALPAQRDERTKEALAEARAVSSYGRTRDGRRALASSVRGEPTLKESWLRSLVGRLNAG